MDLTITQASAMDTTLLADIGARTFSDAFATANDPTDMDQYLAENFSPANLARELSQPGSCFLLAFLNQRAIGYAKLRTGKIPKCVTGPNPVELERIYVEHDQKGIGAGAALMRAIKSSVVLRRGTRG